MLQIYKYSLVIFVIFLKYSDEARILASIPTASYSHQVALRPIWKELAKRGHEIVLLTTDPMKENITNIKQIDMSFSYKILEKHNYSSFVSNHQINQFQLMKKMGNLFQEINCKQLESPEVQNLIHNESEKFDLLMVELIFPVHLGFAERFETPIIGLTSFDPGTEYHKIMGNSINPIVNPDLAVPLTVPLNFWERLYSTSFMIVVSIANHLSLFPKEDKIYKKNFGEIGKALHEIMKNIDMLFMNVNPIFHRIRAISPNTITFGGGSHIEKTPKPLPQKLKNILDNAENGVIYFSLGSNVKSNTLSSNLKEVLMNTFAELPFTILWKFETEDMPNKPKNVIISKWFPQSDLLRHPNLKLFITQCGLQSMEEAVMANVPMVGLPFFVDQPYNADAMVKNGFGIKLDVKTLTKDIFKKAIIEVTTNDKYKENIKVVADLLNDVEFPGIEKVVWWTEYVIRNKGAKVFRNPVLNVPLYQYLLLDVIAFVLVLLLTFVFVIKKSLQILYNLHKN